MVEVIVKTTKKVRPITREYEGIKLSDLCQNYD